MRIKTEYLWLALLLVVSPAQSFSQQSTDYLGQIGFPQFSTQVPVELGTVNTANGNLHLEIPVIGMPGRGSTSYRARFMYDSRKWEIFDNGTSKVWQLYSGQQPSRGLRSHRCAAQLHTRYSRTSK